MLGSNFVKKMLQFVKETKSQWIKHRMESQTSRSRSGHRRCSLEKAVRNLENLEISQDLQKNTCAGVSL